MHLQAVSHQHPLHQLQHGPLPLRPLLVANSDVLSPRPVKNRFWFLEV
eukprot:IDg10171t1